MTAVNDRLDVAANIVSIPTKVPAWQRGYARRLILVDVLGVLLAIGLAQWLRFGALTGDVATLEYLDYPLFRLSLRWHGFLR